MKLHWHHFFNADYNSKVSLNVVTLIFDNETLENEFKNHFNLMHLKMFRFGIVLTLLLFSVYMYLDRFLYPDFTKELFVIRILENSFLLAMLYVSVKKEYFIPRLQQYGFLTTVVTGIALLAIYSFPVSNNFIFEAYAAIVLLIIASFVIYGNRFIVALSSLMIVVVLMGVLIYQKLGLEHLMFFQFLFLSSILLAGVAAYWSEYRQRILFLEMLYSKKIEKALEKKIEELLATKEELKKQATFDYLTKLFNRRYFMDYASILVALADRDKTPLSVLMIDIDKFKNINDTYGHKIGDKVLIALSKKLMYLTRKGDIVARFGGEEFAILLPNTDREGAVHLAEKIRSDIEKMRIPLDDFTIEFTISIGLDTYRHDKAESIDDFLHHADTALYHSKSSGRNRVSLHEEGLSSTGARGIS